MYVFWYVKVYIFWKIIQYTKHWDETQMLEKLLLDKTLQNIYFFSRVPTHHNFTFNLKFLYNLKNSVQLSKTVCMIFYFWFRPIFMKGCIFVQLKEWTLSLSKVIIRLKIKITENPHTVLLPDLCFLNCNKKFENSMIITWVEALRKLPWRWN